MFTKIKSVSTVHLQSEAFQLDSDSLTIEEDGNRLLFNANFDTDIEIDFKELYLLYQGEQYKLTSSCVNISHTDKGTNIIYYFTIDEDVNGDVDVILTINLVSSND